MENFAVALDANTLNLLRQPGADIAAFLTGLFAPGRASYSLLTFELQREFKQGGSPDVTRMVFDRAKYNTEEGKGSFRIVLDVRFTFGCEDSVTERRGETSEWTFAVDNAVQAIRFYSSPFAESRSTADEF